MKKILFILATMLLGSVGLHASNTITYEATARLKHWGDQRNLLEPGATTFGPVITSHEFSNGIGTITCAGEITTIGMGAFSNCENLTSVEIPNSVTTIGRGAFALCNHLQTVNIPESVTSIGEAAFNGCSKLTSSIRIPDLVTKIEFASFLVCRSIPSVIIGMSVTEIDDLAFGSCEKMKTIVCCAQTPPSLGEEAFGDVPTNNLSVYVPDVEAYKNKWTIFPASCFKPFVLEIEGVRFEIIDEDKVRVITKEGGYSGNIVIPEQITCGELSFTVTEIGQSAFEGCNNLTSVTIPVSVKEIGAWAFKNCTNLSKLEFAERSDAINIGIYAFENMAVTEVSIPAWMTNIPEGLFFNNTKLKAIYLHEGVNSIDKHPFGLCPFEYIISMSSTPPALAEGAFEGHDKDANVIVYVPTPDAALAYKNSKWGDYFANCISNITYKVITPTTVEVVHAIPANGAVNLLPVVTLQGTNYTVVGIGNEALKGDTSLRSISLPATIQYIGDSAFSGCTKLKQTNSRAWEDLQTIGASAFYGCSALDSIYIPDAVQTIGKSAFMECKNLTSISLPTGLKNIPDECFHKCPLGTEIIVPEGVETIGKYAFEGTEEARLKAKGIALPSTLKEINFAAFYLHDGLKTITCRALIPPTLTEQVFASKQFQAQQITVYVPNRDVVTAYKRSNWGDSVRYNFKFSDLMAEENKAYLYEVAGDNKEAKAIADAYCDSIDRATTTQQVQYYINTALTKIDKYTLNDYKIKLANYLDSVAGENLDALRIAEEYRKKILLAIFRQEAEKIFAEGLAKINAVFELIDFKKACCDNLRNSAQNLGKEIKEIAEEYCILINQATTKEEANRIYLDGSQEISMYMQLSRYWEEPSNPGECRTTYGYPK